LFTFDTCRKELVFGLAVQHRAADLVAHEATETPTLGYAERFHELPLHSWSS
jgi:hypothetical protein